MGRPLSEKELEDLKRYTGSYRLDSQRDPKQMMQDSVTEPYNATEDIPEQFRRATIDKSYDAYAEDSPVYGNFLKLKRMIGKTLYGGNEK
jgi:hypothetical protein